MKDDGIDSVNLLHETMYQNIIGNGKDNVEIVVERLINALQFKRKLVGTIYLREAILNRFARVNVARVGLSCDVYPYVAKKLHSTVNRVERAIRNTINDCFEHGALQNFNYLMQSQVISPKYAPSNGELLSVIVSWLWLEQKLDHIKYDNNLSDFC